MIKNAIKLFFFLLIFISTSSCEDLFLRFKYETYDCDKNFFNLKKVFIKNYEVGDLVDVEFNNEAFKLEIVKNQNNIIIIERDDPTISIKIDKKLEKLNVSYKNHIQNIGCKRHVFKM